MLGQDVRPASRGLVLASLRHVLHWGSVLLMAAVAAALAMALVPQLFGFTTYVVYGGSMGEALPQGSVAIADWVPATEVQEGDTIIIGTDGPGERVPKAHRVTRMDTVGDRRVIQTKGDANPAPDTEALVLAGSDPVMKVHLRVPLAGYLVHFVQTPLGWALAVLLPATLLCAAILRDIWRPRRKGRQGIGEQRWAA